MVRLLSISGIALALAGIWALRALDPARRPEGIASALSRQNNPAARTKAAAVFAQAVRADSASAYRWADFAEALAAAGRIEEARRAFQRATDLAEGVPQIWFHDAIFHFELGENDLGLRSVRRVLDEAAEYDAVFFDYFDRLELKPRRVLAEIEQNQRATRSYTEHLITVNNADGAQEAWRTLVAHRFIDDRLTASYISCLLRNHRYEAARSDWAASQQQPDFQDSNLVFNGDFERPFTGCPLDWAIQPSEHFETTRDDSVAYHGHWSLKIHFHGDGNVTYANIMQTVRVHPGRHHLSAWIRTENITTNEGIRLEILDPESPARLALKTSVITGSHDWMVIDAPFVVPQSSNLIAVRVIRSPSLMFDNAISGTAWLDSVSVREGS
jgi:tetratricopeptide (TPR) repeat protein